MDKIKNKLILHYILLQLTCSVGEEEFNARVDNVASLEFNTVHLVSVLLRPSNAMVDGGAL